LQKFALILNVDTIARVGSDCLNISTELQQALAQFLESGSQKNPISCKS